MNAILATALRDDGDTFIPGSVMEYLGGTGKPSISASIKGHPRDFIVEEQSSHVFRCTTNTKSDSENPYCESGIGNKIAVTLVKCRLTTEHAIAKLLELLGKSPREVTVSYAGLKDRWAITSQRVVLEGNITFDEVLRACMPDEDELLRGSGIFIKDPERVKNRLERGHLLGNNFTIRVLAKGSTCSDLESYIEGRIGQLSSRSGTDSFMFPNAYGRQRLGRRQNLFGVGYEFIVNGPEAGIKRFLTEVNSSEKPDAQNARRRIAVEWEAAEARARETGSTVAKQATHLAAILEILEESVGHRGTKLCEQYNMVWEAQIAKELLRTLDYEQTLRNLYKVFSLWVGAYQGFWFNQVLGKVLRSEIILDGSEPDHERQIPLFTDNPKSEKFYARHCPEAIPARMNETVRKVFMSTLVNGKDRRTGKPKKWHRKPPRRPLFVAVQGFDSSCADGVATLNFMLRSGAYATTLLDILFDIKQPN